MALRTPTFVVIGGGISGLVGARTLRRARPEARIVLLESDERLGGKIRTETIDGVRFEAGADSFLTRDTFLLELCGELGLADDLIPPAIFGAEIATGGRRHRMGGDYFLGVPASPRAILTSSVLSTAGKIRALGDLFLPGPLTGPDVAIGDFVARRFGHETLDRLVDPILAGTRAGDPRRISLAAAAPALDRIARSGRSVTLALRKERNRASSDVAAPVFVGLRDGMSTLVDALVADLVSVELRTSGPVRVLALDGGRAIVKTDTDDVEADGVLVTVPAHVAGGLMVSVAPEASRELSSIRYATVVSIAFVFDAGLIDLPPGASGLLIPSSEDKTLAAGTWFSAKWPHAADPGGRVLVRCFVGRAAGDVGDAASDADLVERVLADLREVMGWNQRPAHQAVTRWEPGLPQYEVGHREKVKRIEAAVARAGPIRVAGAGLRGSGLPDCARSAAEAATALARSFR